MSGWRLFACCCVALGMAGGRAVGGGARWDDSKESSRKGPVTEDRDIWGNGGYVVRNTGLPEATSRPVRISRRVMLEGELEAAKTQLQAALDKASAEEARRKQLEAELADVKAQLEAFDKAAPTPQAATRTYTVKKGDTLWEIADAMYGSGLQWPRIYNANKDTIDDPNRIKAGQVLHIP